MEPRSELARLKAGVRKDYLVQGTPLDNVAETFVQVDGQWFAILINMDDLRMTTPGRSVLVSAIKVQEGPSEPLTNTAGISGGSDTFNGSQSVSRRGW